MNAADPTTLQALGGLPCRLPALICDPVTGRILGAVTALSEGGYWCTPAICARSFTSPTPADLARTLDGIFKHWQVFTPTAPAADRWPGVNHALGH